MYEFVAENPLKTVEIVVALGITVLTGCLVLFTKQLASESRTSRKEAKTPSLSAKLKLGVDIRGILDLVICNVGRGTAFDVSFRLEGLDEEDCKRCKIVVRGNKAPINFMLPEEAESYLFSSIDYVSEKSGGHPSLKPFSVKLICRDIDGNKYENICQIDVRQFEGLQWSVASVAWQQMKALEKMRRALEKIERRFFSLEKIIKSKDFLEKPTG